MPATGSKTRRAVISTGDKVRYIDLLSETGLKWIEATSFVSPKAIPQLADAAEVFARIRKAPGVRYPVLVPNIKGYERAEAAGADAIAVFTAASEHFTKRNINMTIDESLATFAEVVARRKARRHVGARLRLDGLRLAVRRRRDAADGRRRQRQS